MTDVQTLSRKIEHHHSHSPPPGSSSRADSSSTRVDSGKMAQRQDDNACNKRNAVEEEEEGEEGDTVVDKARNEIMSMLPNSMLHTRLSSNDQRGCPLYTCTSRKPRLEHLLLSFFFFFFSGCGFCKQNSNNVNSASFSDDDSAIVVQKATRPSSTRSRGAIGREARTLKPSTNDPDSPLQQQLLESGSISNKSEKQLATHEEHVLKGKGKVKVVVDTIEEKMQTEADLKAKLVQKTKRVRAGSKDERVDYSTR